MQQLSICKGGNKEVKINSWIQEYLGSGTHPVDDRLYMDIRERDKTKDYIYMVRSN